MKRSGCLLVVLCSVLSFANLLAQDNVQHIPAAVISDPPSDPVHPATMAWPDIPSHGAKMYAVIYIAAGEGPHPTVLMLHGFPGNEKNLDLAYSIRRAGWNVLVPFYRGAWGSGGTFSLHSRGRSNRVSTFSATLKMRRNFASTQTTLCLSATAWEVLLPRMQPHTSRKCSQWRSSQRRISVSLCASSGVNDPQFWERWNDNASRLVGTTAEAVVKELDSDSTKWNYMNCVPLLKNRPVLVLEADDRNTSDNQELADRLHKGGDARVTEVHMHTDHPFSDHRIAMQAAIVNWLESIMRKTP